MARINLTVKKAKKYVDEGHFAAGSMLPKVQAAMDFASSGKGSYRYDHTSGKSQRRNPGKNRYHDPSVNIIKIQRTFHTFFRTDARKKQNDPLDLILFYIFCSFKKNDVFPLPLLPRL